MINWMQRLALANWRRLLLCMAMGLSTLAVADPTEQLFPPAEPDAAVLEKIAANREQAITEQKLLMLVMGADWCHDSQGLVRRMSDPAFAALLAARYQVLLINIGYLEHIRGIVNPYQVPVIYGTPTVLIIEPVSNTLLNRETLPYWRAADSIALPETLDYFAAFSPEQLPVVQGQDSPQLAAALQQIDAFEQTQAERIYLAYAELGRLMRDSAPNKPGAEFLTKWGNLGKMRGSITEDLSSMRHAAREQDAAGTQPIVLNYPDYPLFIDGTTP
ncbi:MAG: hypothetical protein ABJ308_04410 [Halieaceae bacterium]